MPILATYFFQGEPGESQELPNAFTVPLTAPITFDQFLRHFPPGRTDPEAKLHFRFRVRDKNYQYVWVDIVSKDADVPLFNNIISVKVLRTDSIHACTRYSRLRRKQDADHGLDGANAARKVLGVQRESTYHDSAPNSGNSSSSGNSQAQNAPTKVKSQKQPPLQQQQQQQQQQKPSVSPTIAPVPVVDLFDFNDSPPAQAKQATNAFAPTKFDTPTSSTESMAIPIVKEVYRPAPMPVQLDRADLIAKREAQIQENVHRALEEKQERDGLQRQESDDMEIARLKHDANLTEWAFDASKKKRNMRTLLSTMHKVLWEKNRWKEIGLGDVLQPRQVKLSYRKAMLVVHPDRLSGEAPEVRFIAKRVFEAINEQYQEFLKSESVD